MAQTEKWSLWLHQEVLRCASHSLKLCLGFFFKLIYHCVTKLAAVLVKSAPCICISNLCVPLDWYFIKKFEDLHQNCYIRQLFVIIGSEKTKKCKYKILLIIFFLLLLFLRFLFFLFVSSFIDSMDWSVRSFWWL